MEKYEIKETNVNRAKHGIRVSDADLRHMVLRTKEAEEYLILISAAIPHNEVMKRHIKTVTEMRRILEEFEKADVVAFNKPRPGIGKTQNV